MRELSLFTGAGGGLLGSALLGWNPVGYVERNEYCQKVIRQRIEDGCIPRAPIFGDIRSFTGEGYAESYQGMVDVVTAGFPCQPFSVCGHQKGEKDKRNMWPETLDVIRVVRPEYVYLENVPGLLVDNYIKRVFGDLAALGFNARWGVLGGFDVGGVCDGKRLWVVAAASHSAVLEGLVVQKHRVSCTEESCRRQYTRAIGTMLSQDDYARVKRDHDAVAVGMERLKAVGNGQMGTVAATAWRLLSFA